MATLVLKFAIVISILSCNKDSEVFTPHLFNTDIEELILMLSTEELNFEFNPQISNIIDVAENIVLYIPAKSLLNKNGDSDIEHALAKIKIMNSRGDLIKNSVNLQTIEGEIIHQYISFHVEFQSNEEILSIDDRQEKVIVAINTSERTDKLTLFKRNESEGKLWYNTCTECSIGNVIASEWTIFPHSDVAITGFGYTIELSESGWFCLGTISDGIVNQSEEKIEITIPENFAKNNTRVFVSLYQNRNNLVVNDWSGSTFRLPNVLSVENPVFDIFILSLLENGNAAYYKSSRHHSGEVLLKEAEFEYIKSLLDEYE